MVYKKELGSLFLILNGLFNVKRSRKASLFFEVIPSIRKKGFYGKINRSKSPNFYLRYKDNFHRIDRDYFSVISDLFLIKKT